MASLLIRGGRVVDPSQSLDRVDDLLIRARGGMITSELVGTVLPSLPPAAAPDAGAETLQELETRRIREALDQAAGSKTEAAKILGISRRRMYSRLKILGIEP